MRYTFNSLSGKMWTGKLYRGLSVSTPIYLFPAVSKNDEFTHMIKTGSSPVGREKNEVTFKELLF